MITTGPGGAPVVSIVIPCYNGEQYLAQSVESAVAQTYPRVEVIVIDDGSSDGSWGVVESFGERVKGVRQENQGLPRTRNRGIALAAGDFFLFLDSDDRIAPDTVDALVATARATPGEVIACCPWRYLVREHGEWRFAPADVPFPQTNADPLAGWLEGEWIPGCSLLWPRALLERLGGYDDTLTADEDGDLMYRALASGARLAVAAGGESFYRRHGTAAVSVSNDVFSEHRFRSRMRVFGNLEEELRRNGTWERYRPSLGIAYQALAQRIYGARPDLAREALGRGEALAGRRSIAPTLPGRVLVRLLGMDGKERVVNALARFGVMTPGRRALHQLRRMMENTPPIGDPKVPR